jgi:LacI family transcriptional regulator
VTTKRLTKVQDVAKAAGVSVATVSRTFNDPDIVRADLRKRVLDAAAKLRYTPSSAARALRTRKTHIVGAVIPTLDYAIYARMVDAFQDALANAGYMVFVLAVGFDNGRLFDKVRLLVERGAEALLMVGRLEDDRLREFIRTRHIPTATTYSFQIDDPVASIGFDNEAAERQLVEYLIGLGHTRIVMIAGPVKGNDRQQTRIATFNAVLKERGLPEGIVIEKDYGFAMFEGAEALRRIVNEYPETTAVICNSDVFAFSVLAECRQLGIEVPRDLSVTGFDDFDFAAMLDPPLTTIAVPARQMGERAAESLMQALAASQSISPVRLETDLVIRRSTGKPRVGALPGRGPVKALRRA